MWVKAWFVLGLVALSACDGSGRQSATPVDASPRDGIATVWDVSPARDSALVVDARDAAAGRDGAPDTSGWDAQPDDFADASPDMEVADGGLDQAVATVDARPTDLMPDAAEIIEARNDAAAPDVAVPDVASAAPAYWVSPAGSDSSGDGSKPRPWHSIGFAAAHADYGQGVPTLNLAAGTYDEKVVLRDSVNVAGAGAGQVTIQNSATTDSDYVITADGRSSSVPGVVVVTVTGLRVNGMAAKNRGILATQAVLVTRDVNVYQPSGYAISIGPNIAGFDIDRTTVGFVGMLYSDVGVDVGNGSSGTISALTGGDHIDHIINIGLGCTVLIRDCTLTGSPIYYADGIRIQGASTVTIQNTTIVRPPGGEPASKGVHNPPYAGIEIAASSNGDALVTVDHVSTRGFDVGIGINLVYNRVLVHDSTVLGISADVRTIWSGFLPEQYPAVDLGGGGLGSLGGNDFGTGSEPAIDLGGPYGVSAKNDLWGTSAIDTRIHDQLDDSKLGRVAY